MTTETPKTLPSEPSSGVPSSTSRWTAVASILICGGLLAVVIALAGREDDPGAPPPGASAGEIGVPLRTNGGGVVPDPAKILAQAGCGTFDPERPPRIVIDLPSEGFDLGRLKQGVQVSEDVAFRNDGLGALCIARVTTGCGCLKATLVGDKKRFDPGEQGIIRLAADTTGRVGIIRKQVTLTCNDPTTPLKSFRVTMNIAGGLIVEPRYLQFGNVPPNTSATRAMHLRSEKSEDAWEITGIKSVRQVNGLEAVTYEFEVEPLEDPKWRHLKLRVIHPGLPRIGPFRDQIVIETTHPDRPTIELQAHIHIVPRIVSRTRVVTLGFVMPGAPRAPTRVRIQAGAPPVVFDITKVEVVPLEGRTAGSEGPGFRATFGRDTAGWWVDVQYDGKSRQAGLLEAELVVHTDDEIQPEVRVPIRATIRKR